MIRTKLESKQELWEQKKPSKEKKIPMDQRCGQDDPDVTRRELQIKTN